MDPTSLVVALHTTNKQKPPTSTPALTKWPGSDFGGAVAALWPGRTSDDYSRDAP